MRAPRRPGTNEEQTVDMDFDLFIFNEVRGETSCGSVEKGITKKF